MKRNHNEKFVDGWQCGLLGWASWGGDQNQGRE